MLLNKIMLFNKNVHWFFDNFYLIALFLAIKLKSNYKDLVILLLFIWTDNNWMIFVFTSDILSFVKWLWTMKIKIVNVFLCIKGVLSISLIYERELTWLRIEKTLLKKKKVYFKKKKKIRFLDRIFVQTNIYSVCVFE